LVLQSAVGDFTSTGTPELTMREPMVGSLIYGDHKVPKKTRPWRERWKLPVIVGVSFVAIGFLVYQYHNYREEGAVKEFLADISSGQTDAAFAMWDIDGSSYTMQDFLTDWGKDGYYTKGAASLRVVDSNSRGQSVVVYVDIDTFNVPLALRVNKDTLKLSYSPSNKYKVRASR
jgi:hypothetical protein